MTCTHPEHRVEHDGIRVGRVDTDGYAAQWEVCPEDELGGFTYDIGRDQDEPLKISPMPGYPPPSQPVPSGAAGPSDEDLETRAARAAHEAFHAEPDGSVWRRVARAVLAEAQDADGEGVYAWADASERAANRFYADAASLRTALRAMARRSAQRRGLVVAQRREITSLRAERDRARDAIRRLIEVEFPTDGVVDYSSFRHVQREMTWEIARAEVAGRTEGGE